MTLKSSLACIIAITAPFKSSAQVATECKTLMPRLVKACRLQESIENASLFAKEINSCLPPSKDQDAFKVVSQYLELRKRALERKVDSPDLLGSTATCQADSGVSVLKSVKPNCAEVASTLSPKNWSVIDTDYLRKYCESSNSQKPPLPHQLASFSMKAKRLSFMGVMHSYYFNHSPNERSRKEDLFSAVRKTVQEAKPNFILVEGFPSSLGPMPCETLPLLFDANSPSKQDEMNTIMLEAVQAGVPFMGWEPSDESMARFLDD